MTTTDPAERLPDPSTAGWDAPKGTFDGSGFRRPGKDERPGQHREPCRCKVCAAAYQRGHDKGMTDERERIRAALGVPLWHSTVPVAYFRADDVTAILDAGTDR